MEERGSDHGTDRKQRESEYKEEWMGEEVEMKGRRKMEQIENRE